MENQMDNQYNQQTHTNPYQPGDPYQQGNPYPQGNAYQPGNPYPQGGSYQQGNPYPQGNPYQQGTPYQQGNSMGNCYGNYGANSEPQKAPNIFLQFAFAFVPTRYDRLTKVKTGSMIAFVTLLVLIATVFASSFVLYGLASVDWKELAEQLPEFKIAGGHLYMEEDFLYDEDDVFLYMTEDMDEFSYEDAAMVAEDGYRNVILMGRDRISIMQNGQYQQADFSDFGNSMEISREWIASTFAPLVMVTVAVLCVILFVIRVLGYFLFAAVYLLFAMLIASIMKKNLETGALFRTAVYAKVLMFVAATVINWLPFADFSVPFLFKVVVTIGFMAFAIAKLPDNRPVPMTMGPGMGQGWQ